MADTVKLVSRVVIQGKIEDVWREITKTNEPQLAMFGAQMHRLSLAEGSPIRMRTPDGKYPSVAGGVEFTLTSEAVPAGTKTARSMRQGGDFIAATLKAVVERGKPPILTRFIYAVFSVLTPLMTPAKSRSEHWPLEGATRG